MPYVNAILFVICFSLNALAQVSPDKIEAEIEKCLNENISTVADWDYLIPYFENYLVKNQFGDSKRIGKAYITFLNYRINHPHKFLPALDDRSGLKKKLINAGIVERRTLVAKAFIKCFYDNHLEYKSYPSHTINDIIFLGDTLTTSPKLENHILMRALKVSLTETDFQKPIYKKAVILLSIVYMIYKEELTTGVAGDDNPFKKGKKKVAKDTLSN